MKYVLQIAIVGMFFCPKVMADVTALKKERHHATNEMRAFENLDSKLASLEAYTVTYVEPKKTFVVMKTSSHMAKAHKEVGLKLIQVRKKKPVTRTIAQR